MIPYPHEPPPAGAGGRGSSSPITEGVELALGAKQGAKSFSTILTPV